MVDCASKRMRADGGASERTVIMALENKLGITNSAELAREEEKISKKRHSCCSNQVCLTSWKQARLPPLQRFTNIYSAIYMISQER